jgi:hypothetical protein
MQIEKKEAVIFEIKAQLIEIDILLPKEENVTNFVELLSKKRQLTELLNELR